MYGTRGRSAPTDGSTAADLLGTLGWGEAEWLGRPLPHNADQARDWSAAAFRRHRRLDLDGDGFLDAVCSHGGEGGSGTGEDGNELWRSLGGGDLALVPDAGGMFDAVGHAFSTVAIGGFSTHNESLAYWDNPTIEAVAMVFMAIAGINFALHFSAWRRASAQPYFTDPELKVYAVLLVTFAVLVSFALYLTGTYD